jgi:hypothetical protein
MLTKRIFLFFLIFAALTGSVQAEQKKIALVFLTRSGVNHPHFWQKLLEKHSDKFNVYLYADHSLSNPFFESFRIKTLIPTSWDYHINTWQLLLKTAYANEENYKFVYLSESCIPIIPLEKIYDELVKDSNSYLVYARPWWPKDNIREVIELPEEHRWGNHEWTILNRKHAGMIVNDKDIINIVSRFWIDSESYPSTLFSARNCLHECVCKLTTYVNWTLAEGGGAHPYQFREFNTFNYDMLMQAKRDGCFFARKFNQSFPKYALFQIMYAQP